MSKFEDGLKLFDECCGNKDNVISLSTIELDLSAKGNPRPAVRDVGAFYEDGVFYVSTNAKSNKIRQIEKQRSRLCSSFCRHIWQRHRREFRLGDEGRKCSAS